MADMELPRSSPDSESELTAEFARTFGPLFAADSVQQTLERVVEAAVATIDGCDFAGIFLSRAEEVRTVASTDPIVDEVDDLQCATEEGPCLDAMAQRVAFYAADLSDDVRWAQFGPEATARDIRCLLAFPILYREVPGALNLYARYPEAFGVTDRGKGALLAALAGLALSSARTHEDDEQRSTNLHAGLATRELIGQAQGILMERERITPNQAFDILRRASQRLNIKLRDIAQDVVDTGSTPEGIEIAERQIPPPKSVNRESRVSPLTSKMAWQLSMA